MVVENNISWNHPTEGILYKFHIDPSLLVAVMLIFIISLIAIYSASNSNVDVLINQSIRIIIATISMVMIAQLSPLTYERIGFWLYLLCVSLLAIVLLLAKL